jgi:Peptidase family M28/PA domain
MGREDVGERTTGPDAATPQALARAVTLGGLFGHLEALQRIADENGGTRETGSPGYEASVVYVARTLRRAGYEPRLQQFRVATSLETKPPQVARLSPRPQTFTRARDYVVLEYSGSGEVAALVRSVDTGGKTSACEDSDFEGFPAGAVALARRGGCFFFEKAVNAERAGAAALLVFNDGLPGHEGAISATLVEPGFRIPAVSLANDLGEELAAQAEGGALRMRISVAVTNEKRESTNVLAELPGRRAGGVVLLGAHLDSVGSGPGINDNGSGVATVLEAAVQLRRLGTRPERGLRFAFWAAEELGLHGSKAYVARLGSDAQEEITAVLNFDMLASPNFARLVYDADDELTRAFLAWFEQRGLEAETVALEGRSDHAPFEARGIPVGGLFAGADETNGGTPYDPCYHQGCDTLANVNRAALEQMADAAAAVAFQLALDTNTR